MATIVIGSIAVTSDRSAAQLAAYAVAYDCDILHRVIMPDGEPAVIVTRSAIRETPDPNWTGHVYAARIWLTLREWVGNPQDARRWSTGGVLAGPYYAEAVDEARYWDEARDAAIRNAMDAAFAGAAADTQMPRKWVDITVHSRAEYEFWCEMEAEHIRLLRSGRGDSRYYRPAWITRRDENG